MHSTLFIAVMAGLGGMFGWGLADFFAKKTVDNIGPIKSLVWAHSCGTVLFVILALGQTLVLNRHMAWPHGLAWLGLAGFGLLQMIVYWLVYKAFEKGQLAVLNPIFASFTGIVALVAIIGFGEKANARLLAGLVILFAGIILVNVDLQGLKSKKLNLVPGLKEIGAATVLAAAWTLGWDKFVSGQDSLAYALWMYAFMTLAAIGLAYLMKEKKLADVPLPMRKFLFLMGAGETMAYLAISWGYGSTNLTDIVALVSGAFSVPTVILAYIFLKERLTQLQAVAIVIIIAAIGIVSMG